MVLDFERLPRFKPQAMKIVSLTRQWAYAHGVPEEAVITQIYTAHAWCDSNPKRAPKKDMARFLWSWMGQAKRYGNLVVRAKEAPREPVVENEGDMTVEEMRAIRRRNMPQYRGDPQKFPGAIETGAENVS